MTRLRLFRTSRLSHGYSTHQVPPRFLLVVFCLQLVDLQEALESSMLISSLLPLQENPNTHVRHPSSVTSRNSISSFFVSWLNGAPFVSRAHSSNASAVKNAPAGGVNSDALLVPSAPLAGACGVKGLGVQYFANMCFKQASS